MVIISNTKLYWTNAEKVIKVQYYNNTNMYYEVCPENMAYLCSKQVIKNCLVFLVKYVHLLHITYT